MSFPDGMPTAGAARTAGRCSPRGPPPRRRPPGPARPARRRPTGRAPRPRAGASRSRWPGPTPGPSRRPRRPPRPSRRARTRPAGRRRRGRGGRRPPSRPPGRTGAPCWSCADGEGLPVRGEGHAGVPPLRLEPRSGQPPGGQIPEDDVPRVVDGGDRPPVGGRADVDDRPQPGPVEAGDLAPGGGVPGEDGLVIPAGDNGPPFRGVPQAGHHAPVPEPDGPQAGDGARRQRVAQAVHRRGHRLPRPRARRSPRRSAPARRCGGLGGRRPEAGPQPDRGGCPTDGQGQGQGHLTAHCRHGLLRPPKEGGDWRANHSGGHGATSGTRTAPRVVAPISCRLTPAERAGGATAAAARTAVRVTPRPASRSRNS